MKTATPQVEANHGKDRHRFWLYCQRVAKGAEYRARLKSLPFEIDAFAIDELLVDQRWRCAISDMALSPPGKGRDQFRDPFGPSLDRIVPQLGYVRGNLRVVCNLANYAINEWGAEALEKFIDAMSRRQK